MSRNVRHKSDATPTKKPVKRRAKSYDSSSESDYAGVDLVSDSEDEDEPDVEAAEAQAIIESEEDDDVGLHTTARPQHEYDEESWNGFDQDSQSNLNTLDETFFDDHIARTSGLDYLPDPDEWNNYTEEPVRKNVRFDVSDDSSSDSEDGFFPDLFVERENLDPAFLRQLESDEDEHSDSYLDFSTDVHAQLEQDDVEDSDESPETYSSCSSSESEDDEETDDEVFAPINKTAHPRSVLRRPSTESEADEEITINRRAPPRTPGRPRLGTWTATPDRPFAMMCSRGKKVMLFPAKLPPRPHTSEGTSHSQNISGLLPSAMDNSDAMSPMISNSANLMMSAMFTPLDPFANQNALGPPEAFFPFVDISANGQISQDTPSFSGADDDFDDDGELWVEDFMNFETDSEDEADEDEEDNSGSMTNDEIFPSPLPRTATTQEPQSRPLNPNLVGAFRKNQYRHKIMSRHNATDNSLLFSGPLAHTAVRGIKDGRLAAAAVPISPLRKYKKTRAQEASSPLAPQTTKRKPSSELAKSHKRSKSVN